MLDRLSYTLLSNGIPIDRILGTQGDLIVTYMPWATGQQIADGDAMIATFDWSQSAHDAWLLARVRQAAQPIIEQQDSQAMILRALVKVLVDELNATRQWITDFKANVAAASNLSALKNGVAAQPNLPDRTLQQAKTAIMNAIETGGAD